MLEAFALSDRGCVRANNEDYCLIRPELGLYLLADGMGGARAGETAARIAVETVEEVVGTSRDRDTQALLRGVEEANRRVIAAAERNPNLEGMGTTLVAALETGPEIALASVGDSRAYVFDSQGFRVVTRDQTWINDVGRPLGLDEESLRHHPMRHVLTMAIGAGAPLSINYYVLQLVPGAVMLLSSDGLHGVIADKQIEAILRGGAGTDLRAVCQQLIDAARAAGGPDSITTVLMRASDSNSH